MFPAPTPAIVWAGGVGWAPGCGGGHGASSRPKILGPGRDCAHDLFPGSLVSGPQARGTPARIWNDLARGAAHGPLPVLLLVLTMATGVSDAVSILGLGRVFVANMTGNVVFVGFALAGAPGFSPCRT